MEDHINERDFSDILNTLEPDNADFCEFLLKIPRDITVVGWDRKDSWKLQYKKDQLYCKKYQRECKVILRDIKNSIDEAPATVTLECLDHSIKTIVLF